MSKQCSFEGCDRLEHAKGLCRSHYRQRMTGKELTPVKYRTEVRRCSVEGCNDLHYAKGLCNKHYGRQRSGNPLEDPPPKAPKPVKRRWNDQGIAGTARGAKNKRAVYHPGQPHPLPLGQLLCDVFGCYSPVTQDGMCVRHAKRFLGKRAGRHETAFGGNLTMQA